MLNLSGHPPSDLLDGWIAEADAIEVTLKGRLRPVKPALRLQLGQSADLRRGFMSLEIVKQGAPLAALLIEEEADGFGWYALSTGRTCGVCAPASDLHRALMRQLGLPWQEAYADLPTALTTLNALLADDAAMFAALRTQGDVAPAGEAACALDLRVDAEASVRGCLRWRRAEGLARPVDLSERRRVPLPEGGEFLKTEGFDAALRKLALKLALEPTLARLAAALAIPL